MVQKVIASGHKGPVHWALEAQGPALRLFSARERNDMVRETVLVAGKQWGAAFLPKRFTDYVDRSPFPYPGHRDGFFLNKARRMGILAPVFKRLFMGWDPWSTILPSPALIQDWKAKNPTKYKFLGGLGSGLVGDLRKNAKRMVMEIVAGMIGEGKFIPLVESGWLRTQVLKNVRYSATATATKATLFVTMPVGLRPGQKSGEGGSNKTVFNVLKTVPGWEVRWYAKKLGENLKLRLNNRGYSVDARGVVNMRAAPDYQAQQNARSFAAHTPRASV